MIIFVMCTNLVNLVFGMKPLPYITDIQPFENHLHVSFAPPLFFHAQHEKRLECHLEVKYLITVCIWGIITLCITQERWMQSNLWSGNYNLFVSVFFHSELINSGELICGCRIRFVPFSGDSRGEAVGLYWLPILCVFQYVFIAVLPSFCSIPIIALCRLDWWHSSFLRLLPLWMVSTGRLLSMCNQGESRKSCDSQDSTGHCAAFLCTAGWNVTGSSPMIWSIIC